MSTDDMLVKLKAMQERYGAKLPGKLAELGEAMQACRDRPDAYDRLETLHRLLHTMAGAAGTFGFDALGLQARQFEQQANNLLMAGRWQARDIDRLALLLPQLQVHLQHAPVEPDKPADDREPGNAHGGDSTDGNSTDGNSGA